MQSVQHVVKSVEVLPRIFQCFRCFQFQRERIRRVAAIARRLAASEILAGVGGASKAMQRRWWPRRRRFASVEAPAWRRQCARFVRMAQERVAEATGRRLRQAEGDGAPGSVGKKASTPLAAAPARATARAALLPLGLPAISRFWMEEVTTSFWHFHVSGQIVAHAFRCTTAAT